MTCEALARVSIPLISNRESLVAQLTLQARTASSENWRALLLMEVPGPAARNTFLGWATPLMPVIDPAQSTTDRNDLLAARLGTEHRHLAVDATQGLDAGAIATLCGTVVAGGVFCLMVTSLQSTVQGSRFGRRLGTHILQAQARHPALFCLARLPPDGVTDTSSRPADLHDPGAPASIGIQRVPDPVLRPASDAAANEQSRLLERLVSQLDEASPSAVTLQGRRGRGKSFLLGRFANALEQRGHTCGVLSVHTNSTASLLTAYRVAEKASRAKNGEQASAHHRTHSPALLDAARLPAWTDVILVDEAASFPVTTLKQASRRCRLLLLATTVDGHEIAGRAFELQFVPWLESEGIPLVRLVAHHPWRWREGCPLEQWLDRLLMVRPAGQPVDQPAELFADPCADPFIDLVDGQPVDSPGNRSVAPSTNLTVARCDRDQLASTETALAQVYSLLLQSHYQSTSLDLQHLLDAPGMDIFVARQDGRLLGAAMTVREGGIASLLHADIIRRRRRLPHQRLPQQLAQCLDDPSVLNAYYVRVVRIVVHPSARRRGVASRMVHCIDESSRAAAKKLAGDLCDTENLTRLRELNLEAPSRLNSSSLPVSALGASFSASAASLAFWSANGFTRFHDGFRTNPRSGLPSATVLKAFTEPLVKALQTAASLRKDNERAQTISLAGLSTTRPHWATALADTDIDRLSRFARGERQLMDTRAAVCRLWLATRAPGMQSADQSDDTSGGWLIALYGSLADSAAGSGATASVKRLTRREREQALRHWVDDQLQRLG